MDKHDGSKQSSTVFPSPESSELNGDEILRILFEASRISQETYSEAFWQSQGKGHTPLEALVFEGTISVEELICLVADETKKRLLHGMPTSPEPQQGADAARIAGSDQELFEIVGNSRVVRELRSLIKRIAPTSSTVLIQGESGTGKELVARAIHRMSPRAQNPLVTINCAAMPLGLIESELFGHKKGAFSGATTDHEGVFRSAHGGTLFLDEIEATSPEMQVKLLRAIQNREIRPVGGTASSDVDVRFLAATNHRLEELVKQNLFREDLFYRINIIQIFLPPLRERIEDIPLLTGHFLNRFSLRSGTPPLRMDPTALDLLKKYPWPGNIRELENELERACVMAGEGSTVSVRCLSQKITQEPDNKLEPCATCGPLTLQEAINQLEERMVREALDACLGNKTHAAQRLGLSRQGLINKLHRIGRPNREKS